MNELGGVNGVAGIPPQEPFLAGAAPGGKLANGHVAYSAPGQELNITEFLRGKTYLVTGVTGFMGTVLVRRLLTPCCTAALHVLSFAFISHRLPSCNCL